jgi:hypothetical protein
MWIRRGASQNRPGAQATAISAEERRSQTLRPVGLAKRNRWPPVAANTDPAVGIAWMAETSETATPLRFKIRTPLTGSPGAMGPENVTSGWPHSVVGLTITLTFADQSQSALTQPPRRSPAINGVARSQGADVVRPPVIRHA